MKPSKKAKQLFLKFKNIDNDSEMFDNFKMKDFYAQRCLLILVDEFIFETSFQVTDARQRYWQKVKEEIRNI